MKWLVIKNLARSKANPFAPAMDNNLFYWPGTAR